MASRKAINLRHMSGFPGIAWGALVFLYAPMLLVILFSFNSNTLITVWEGFSLEWYQKALSNDGLRRAALNSLIIAVSATGASTVFATLAALATARAKAFKGQDAAQAVLNLPLMVPDVVIAIATLSFFTLIGLNFGLYNVIIAHTVFCIPFAYLPIRARLETFDNALFEASKDLYATPLKTFRDITLPLLGPGILSGALLAFVISLDDFIITAMVAGAGSTTLPVYIYGLIRRGITPEVNAISTLLLLLSVIIVSLSYILSKQGNK